MNENKFLRNSKEPKRVVVFNAKKRVVVVVHSVTAAAHLMKTNITNLHFALTGVSISACGHYWRYLYPELKMSMEEIFNLNLYEYDKLCGLERTCYIGTTMGYKGVKRETNPKPSKKERAAQEKKAKETRTINGVFNSIHF